MNKIGHGKRRKYRQTKMCKSTKILFAKNLCPVITAFGLTNLDESKTIIFDLANFIYLSIS
jgi:hypothetical protein